MLKTRRPSPPASPALCFALLAVATLASLAAAPAAAAEQPATAVVELSAPVTPLVFDGDLRDLPAVPEWQPGDPVKFVPKRYYPEDGPVVTFPPPVGSVPDELVAEQRMVGRSATRAPILSFAGIGFTGVSPPDTVGDVGPDYYIQSVNGGGGSLIQIYDKTGTPATARFTLDSLWSGGGGCASGAGDPIVLYDELAGRWVLTEFSGSAFALCVYVSQTGDPVSGGWYAYEFTPPSFPDYPKYAVWHDAYLVTSNEGGSPPIYALERSQMLTGAPATMQRFSVPGLSGFGFEALTPADHDGAAAPPAGAPGYIGRHRDDESHGGSAAGDFIDIWALSVNWATPASSTLTQLPSIDTTEFDSALCGLSTLNCIPQPSGSTLDPLREVLMWRLQYRNMGTHETLVGNLAVDVGDFPDHAGIRWFEARKVGAGDWTMFQEGTYSPDNTHRWMASAAMDQAGEIGLAYSLSDAVSVYPSMGYTGRTASDPPGVMTEAETIVANGDSAQGFNRWGDYSALSVDPADGCTFWLTNEYMNGGSWDTWIASFQLPECACAVPVMPPDNPTAVTAGDNQIDLGWDDSASASVSEYRIDRATTPGGPYTPIATVPDSSPGVGGGAPYVHNDTTVSGGTTYYYVIVADDGASCRTPSVEVNATATGECLLPPTFGGLVEVIDPANCTLDLNWDAGSSNCGGTVTYDIYRDTASGFTPGPANLVASGSTATTWNDNTGLSESITYYYIVRAVDGPLADSNVIERSGSPGGPPGTTVSWPSTDTPLAIPDNDTGGVISTITVTDAAPLRGITVDVEIQHTRMGNVALTLMSPLGTAVRLLNRPARPPRAGCVDDDMLATFDDASAMDLSDHCEGTTPWYSGVAMPLEPLGTLLGEPIEGDWTLYAADRSGGETGQLISWTLNLTPAEPCAPPDCDELLVDPIELVTAVKQGADVSLSWQADINAGEYNVLWVNAKDLIPARSGSGTEVCMAAPAPPTPCIDGGAVPPDGETRYYNVIGACRGVEAAE